MSWTKRQFVLAAAEEIGYADYVFDLQPEKLESWRRRLDSMMATWNGKGIRLGYPIPSTPEDGSLDEETQVPDSANEAIYTNLAIRIAPSVGKSVSSETRKAAKDGYIVLQARASKLIERQMPSSMPAGAGNKGRIIDRPFLDEPTDPIVVGGDGILELN